jgi:hypothetical protein
VFDCLRCGPHVRRPPSLSNRTRHTARRQWLRGCGLISADASARGLDFAGPTPRGGGTYFSRALLVRSSPPPKLQSRADQRPHTELEKAAMATQALLSGRPVQSSVARSSSSRKAPFIVRASSSPPAKVPARRQLGAALLQTYSRTQLTDRFDLQQGADRQLWFASKQSLSYLDGT